MGMHIQQSREQSKALMSPRDDLALKNNLKIFSLSLMDIEIKLRMKNKYSSCAVVCIKKKNCNSAPGVVIIGEHC